MLKNLPIIPSQNFYPIFFFIPIVPPIIPFYSIVSMKISRCRSDYILFTKQIMFTEYYTLIEYLTVLLEYLNRLQTRWQGTANIWEGLGKMGGPGKVTVSRILHISDILASNYSCFMFVPSLKFWNYSCQNWNLLFSKLCWHIRRKPKIILFLQSALLPCSPSSVF